MLRFTYDLVGDGWARALIEGPTGRADLIASSAGPHDAITELTAAVLGLFRGAEHAAATWFEEPGEHRWLLDRVGDRIHLRILWFAGRQTPNRHGDEVFSADIRLAELAGQLKSQLERLLNEHGLDGYLQQWHRPFPQSDYRALKEMIRHPDGPHGWIAS